MKILNSKFKDPIFKDPRFKGPKFKDPRFKDPRFKDPILKNGRISVRTILVFLGILVLAVAAIFTVTKLTGKKPIAPTAPLSKPKATSPACTTGFTSVASGPQATPTSSGATLTPTATPTSAVTATPTLATDACTAPATLVVSGTCNANATASVTWVWDEVDGATMYTLQYDDSADFGSPMSVDTADLTYNLPGMTSPQTTRYSRVRVKTATGCAVPGEWKAGNQFSLVCSGATNTPAATNTPPPATPTTGGGGQATATPTTGGGGQATATPTTGAQATSTPIPPSPTTVLAEASPTPAQLPVAGSITTTLGIILGGLLLIGLAVVFAL